MQLICGEYSFSHLHIMWIHVIFYAIALWNSKISATRNLTPSVTLTFIVTLTSWSDMEALYSVAIVSICFPITVLLQNYLYLRLLHVKVCIFKYAVQHPNHKDPTQLLLRHTGSLSISRRGARTSGEVRVCADGLVLHIVWASIPLWSLLFRGTHGESLLVKHFSVWQSHHQDSHRQIQVHSCHQGWKNMEGEQWWLVLAVDLK